MCLIDDDYTAGVWSDTRVKARKQHGCDCCKGIIEPGQVYVRHFSTWEGDLCSEKLCSVCDHFMDEFGKVEGHPARTTPRSLTDYLSQCISEADDDIYDEESDEYKPGPGTQRWQEMLDTIKARGKTSLASAF